MTRLRFPFFDAHCDALMKAVDEQVDLLDDRAAQHVSVPGLIEADVRAQLFACYVLSDPRPETHRARAYAMIDALEDTIQRSGDRLRLARSARDLREAFDSGPAVAVLGLEGADPLEGRAETLRKFYDRGVRDIIFAWKDNAFSGSSAGRNTGLTGQGERLLGLAEELEIMVDVSHLSDRAFDAVCSQSTRPFIASHSNCRVLCNHPRNLTDSMIRALADRGGVMGINLATGFLSPDAMDRWTAVTKEIGADRMEYRERIEVLKKVAPTIPRPPLDWVARHVLHAIDVGGEAVIGVGGDLDGILQMPQTIERVTDYPKLTDALAVAGLSDRQIEGVCYKNLLRVFTDVLPD